MTLMKQLGCMTLLQLVSFSALGGDIEVTGRWRATNSAGVSSIIELYMVDDRLNGRLLNISDSRGSELHPLCERCKGTLANKPIVGMTFLSGLRRSGPKWVHGKVIDVRPGPLQGVTADCELELSGTQIRFVGYLRFKFLSGVSYWDRIIE